MLAVSGYVRGANLSADRLVHIPNFGNFQIAKVCEESSPFQKRGDMDCSMDELKVIAEPDPMNQVANNGVICLLLF
jgi:pre-rRNA-processing protein TSR1